MKGDSSKFYLQKSLYLFNNMEDEIALCQYAYWHSDEMESDSIIAYMLPYYESVNFTGYASILANTYLYKLRKKSFLFILKRGSMSFSITVKYTEFKY
jgi:hypothetical protein